MSKKNELVVKSNRLIEASYKLNLVEQQIILYSICRSREEQRGLTSDTPVTISAASFAVQFGSNEKKVYGQLKEAMETLYERSVTIYDTDPKTGFPRATKTRWISTASYIDGAGQIQIIFAPTVISFITRLGEEGNYTSYLLEKIGCMSSAHAVRMYELLVQYLSVGTREVEIDWLKKLLELNDDYPRLFDLKKRVLDVGVKQINQHSDIRVSYIQRKTGRTVTHLIFDIKPEPKAGIEKKTKIAKYEKIDARYIEKHARPGESYTTAQLRLLKEAGQKVPEAS